MTRARPARGKPILFRFSKQAALGAGVANTTKQEYWIAPCAGRVVSLQCAAAIVVGAVKPTIGIWKAAALVTDEVTLAAAFTVYDLTPANGTSDIVMAKGDHLTMRAVTNAGDGVLTIPTVSGIFEPSGGLRPDAIIAKLYYPGAIGIDSALTTYRDWWVAPCDGRIDNIQIIGQGQAGAAGPDMQIKNGTTAICTKEEIVANDTVYEVTLSQDQRKVSRGDILRLVTETDGAGELVNPTAIITMIPLNANRARKHTVRLCKPNTALGVGVRDTVAQDILILPEDKRGHGAWLTKASILQTAKAGATAEKAYLDMAAAGLTNLDTEFEAHTAGYNSRGLQIQSIADATGLKASLDMDDYTTNCETVVEAAVAGITGNLWSVLLIPGAGAKVGGWSEDVTDELFVFMFQDGVSDVLDFENAITASANLAVKTVDPDPATLLTAVGDITSINSLTGGTAVTSIEIDPISGAAMKIHFTDGVTTVTNVETLVGALAGADNIIDVKTPGTGAAVLADPDDVLAATNLANGTDGNPTYDVGRFVSGSSTGLRVTVRPVIPTDDVAVDMPLYGKGNDRVKMDNENILAMGATTDPAGGESKNPAIMLELEI